MLLKVCTIHQKIKNKTPQKESQCEDGSIILILSAEPQSCTSILSEMEKGQITESLYWRSTHILNL